MLKQFLAVLDKGAAALGTPDFDFALSFWNPDFLFAGGTPVYVVGFPLCK